jgi:hypothetical protein
LSDPSRKVQKELDIAERTEHVIVPEPGFITFKIYTGYWSFGRAAIEELPQELPAVLRKSRPD